MLTARGGIELSDLFATVEDLYGLFRLSSQCVEQYREQIEPDLLVTEAIAVLYERCHFSGTFVVRSPGWSRIQSGEVGCVVIEDEIALPVRAHGPHDLIAVKTIVRVRPVSLPAPRPRQAGYSEGNSSS